MPPKTNEEIAGRLAFLWMNEKQTQGEFMEEILSALTEKDKELQKAREQTIRDMERKMMGWSGTATAMLKDYRRIIYRDQSELDQPNK